MITKRRRYSVVDHHSIWGWTNTSIPVEKADIIFVWNDFSIEKDVKNWQEQGKKIICFEHGWNAFFDYEYNKREMIADGYMALGNSSAESLLKYGLDPRKVIATGNPNFDNLGDFEHKSNLVPQILYTALHWTRDMTEYNDEKLREIIDKLSPYAYISVKTIEKSKITIPQGVKEWKTDIENNKGLFREIKRAIKQYDIILTPKESTFDFIALKMGKKVFRIGDEQEYRLEGEPRVRNILPLTKLTPEIFFKEHCIMTSIEDELIKSLKLSDILDWVQCL